MKRVLVMLLMIATYLAFDGRALKAANDPRAPQLTYEPWMKACIGATCFVGAGARGACNPSGGIISTVTDEKTAGLSITLGTKRTIEGAISVQIDQGEAILISHPECDGLACHGSVQLDSGFIERLKQSKAITVEATDSNQRKIRLTFSLAGFTEAYSGPSAPPPKVFEETQERLTAEIVRRAEEQKKLECEE